MKAAIISFTRRGAELARRLCGELEEQKIDTEVWLKMKDAKPLPDVHLLEDSAREWTKERFESCGALIFIGAAGIAVRSIAPFVKSKKTDPAVVVVDERGNYAVCLLSGHIGGGNALTRRIAGLIGAEAVITTATDVGGKFAVDEFAARRGYYMDSMEYAKEIAAALVAGERVGIRSAYPLTGRIPAELDTEGCPSSGFCIDVVWDEPFTHTLHLVPRLTVLGIGCKRGMDKERIREAVMETLERYRVFPQSVCGIASIDMKKDEPGLLALAQEFGVRFWIYSAEELAAAESEDSFAESEFVRSVAGVGNVCERAALLAAGTRKLLIPKTACGGVTVAAAVTEYTVCMEDGR